ncbi:MAG: translation initiation factor IF-2 [Acidimicrobiales bacterium]
MAKKIRVYELARELGMTNKETLDLAGSLGIGVKSHSSSVVDAQADRVRRKAVREGLTRDSQPEEPKKLPAKKASAKKPPAKKAAAKKPPAKKAAAEKPPAKKAAAEKPPAKEAAAEKPPAKETAAKKPPAKKAAAEKDPEPTAAEKVAPPAEPLKVSPVSTETDSSAPAKIASTAEGAEPTAAPRRLVKSSGTAEQRRPRADESHSGSPVSQPVAKSAPTSPRSGPPPGAPPRGMPVGKDGKPLRAPAPRSKDGKPVVAPTPGARLTSATGKPIPPPPGQRKAAPAAARTSGRPGSGNRSNNGSRPGGAPAGAPRPGFTADRPAAPAAGRPGSTGRPGGGGRPGGAGRPGGGQRPRPRRAKRRRRQREELQPQQLPSYTPAGAPVPTGEVLVERSLTAQELGPLFNRSAADVVLFLMQQGEMVTATHPLSDDMIELFAAELEISIRLIDAGAEQEEELQRLLKVEEADDEDELLRAPVITVMGHVDHGKTLLLDRIRSANVVAGEAGGITQHIGAYQVIKDGHPMTFIDTPGHEAFTAMRARGADATDIVVLVVAADDGVMPQTLEALDHARAADVPIIVAMNKIDRDNADTARVLTQLAERDLVPEAWGGDTIVVEVSALQELGIDDLLEQIVVVSEIEELVARESGRARGVVLEANLDKGRGPVATVLVQEGVLRVGDPLVAGAAWGRVRALINDQGDQVKEAPPSTPVQVLGLSAVAEAGDAFVVAPDEKTASKVAETREHWRRQTAVGGVAAGVSGGAKLEDLFKQIQAGEAATLNLIVKADVNGSLEATTESLNKLARDDVSLAFVSRGVGGITENDVQLAMASNATIIGFNVRPDRKARVLAENEGVEIRTYEIIYKLLEDIEKAMLGLLEPEFEEIVTGDAEVREIFRVPRIGAIAGCWVQNGVITRGWKVRFLRECTVIWKGAVSSLRRFKDDVREVTAGFECGIGLTDFQDLKPGDIIETYEDREIPVT